MGTRKEIYVYVGTFFYYEEIEQPPSIRYIYLFQRLDYNQTCLKGVEVVGIRNRRREFSIP